MKVTWTIAVGVFVATLLLFKGSVAQVYTITYTNVSVYNHTSY